MPLYVGTVGSPTALVQDRLLTSGEAVLNRWRGAAGSVTAATSGQMLLTYFTAGRTETINTITVGISNGTAAGATPTLVRMGIWAANADGSLSALLASTANDTTLLAALNTLYPKALSSSFSKVVDTRYACGILVVSGAAMPTMLGTTANGTTTSAYLTSPVISALVTGLADLPATVAVGALVANSRVPQFTLTP